MTLNKTVSLAIALSLGANLALAYNLRRLRPSGSTSTPTPASASAVSASPEKHAGPGKSNASSATVADRRLWPRLASGDLATLVANLRKAGVPPKLLRAILRELLDQKYLPAKLAAQGSTENTPYWKSSFIFFSGDKRLTEMDRLDREMTNELKGLLGTDVSLFDVDTQPHLRQLYGSLPSEKIERLQKIHREYREMSAGLSSYGPLLPADREKLTLLQKEERTDIEKFLSPEELFEYDLRSSPVSWRLHGYDEVLELTEPEYRALFPIYKAMDDKLPKSNDPAQAAEIAKARSAAEIEIQDQIKAILGDARYAEYKQSQDKSASQENRLVARLGLPLTAATQLLEAKKEYRDLANSVRADKQLTREQRDEQLIALKSEAENRLTTVLGTRGLAAYRDYGGNWLNSLAPQNAAQRP